MRGVKLTSISLKRWNTYRNISAIKLSFSNGTETPLFATEHAKRDPLLNKLPRRFPEEEMTTIKVDPKKTIASIGIYVCGEEFNGIRLTDPNGEVIADENWGNGICFTKHVPEGHEIIGLKCAQNWTWNKLPKLGFMCWKPPRYK